MRAAMPAALVVVPEGTILLAGGAPISRASYCGIVPAALPGAVFRPSLLKRLFSRSARVALVVSEAGLAYEDEDGDVHAVPWNEVEAVVPRDTGEGFIVIGRNMCMFFVYAEAFGRVACEAVRSRLPQHLWVQRARQGAVPTSDAALAGR